MKSRRIQFYSAQAIAIVMVVLVVAAVLGASLYSRTVTNQKSVTNQQDSDISLEQADTILNLFLEADIDELSDLTNEGAKEYEKISDLFAAVAFSNQAQEIVKRLQDSTNPSTKLCEGSVTDTSSGLKITISRVDPLETVDVSVGDSRNFNFDGYNINSGNLLLTVQPSGSTNPVFAIKKIYKNQGTGDYKPYAMDDNQVYCLAANCDGLIDPSASGTGVSTGIVNIPLTPSTYNIYQIRVIPLIGDISVSYSTSVPDIDFGYIKINAAVNCYGTLGEKEMIIPSTESLGYPTTFDYVLYNNGTLRTN